MRSFAKVVQAMHGLPVCVDMAILSVTALGIVLLFSFGVIYIIHVYPKQKGR
ncbi:hypothetical protein H5R64_07615 [Limosilactobacillus sp. WF-MO7-1]|uniref:Uncharacterized protein n=1 Tax=Limosilactobacillus fastidiosus TaxID=2759855 RepID=A0ABR6E8V1_9LACO|nr:hypothetical protein [Limosilactobacillus fastidiosus]